MGNLESIVSESKKIFDYKIGCITGILMGTLVCGINYHHGFLGATIAGLKQATYTFILGGALTKLCERISVNVENKYLARFLGIVIPSILTIGSTYFIHTLKGTPEPFDSTIPTIILGPLGYAYWSNRKINQSYN